MYHFRLKYGVKHWSLMTFWPTPPPPYFNSVIRCFTMCLETRILPCGINWNHKYHAYCVFLSRIHICFWVLYILMIKLVGMATILEGDVLQANYLSWPHVAICGPRHVVLYFLTLVRTITADFLWIRNTRTGKTIFSSYSGVEGGSVAMATKYGLEGDMRKFVPYPSLLYIYIYTS